MLNQIPILTVHSRALVRHIVWPHAHAQFLSLSRCVPESWDRIDGDTKNSPLMMLTSTSQPAWLTLAQAPLRLPLCALLLSPPSPLCVLSRWTVTHKHMAWIPNQEAAVTRKEHFVKWPFYRKLDHGLHYSFLPVGGNLLRQPCYYIGIEGVSNFSTQKVSNLRSLI